MQTTRRSGFIGCFARYRITNSNIEMISTTIAAFVIIAIVLSALVMIPSINGIINILCNTSFSRELIAESERKLLVMWSSEFRGQVPSSGRVPEFEFRGQCGSAMPRNLVGEIPTWVIASHEPSIEPCGANGNGRVDA